MVRPTLIDLNPVECKYYPFMISLDKCSGRCYIGSLYIYIYYIYTKIKKPKTGCVRVNIKQKNTFSIITKYFGCFT